MEDVATPSGVNTDCNYYNTCLASHIRFRIIVGVFHVSVPQLYCFLWQKLLVINQEICLGSAGVSRGPKQIPAAAGFLLKSEWIRHTASWRLQANAHFLFPVLKTNQEHCKGLLCGFEPDKCCLYIGLKLSSWRNRRSIFLEEACRVVFSSEPDCWFNWYMGFCSWAKSLKLCKQLIKEPVAVIAHMSANTRMLMQFPHKVHSSHPNLTNPWWHLDSSVPKNQSLSLTLTLSVHQCRSLMLRVKWLKKWESLTAEW